ncbi:MAG TPA: OmpH family outer membrane protein [Acidiferrobacterales bacterium]
MSQYADRSHRLLAAFAVAGGLALSAAVAGAADLKVGYVNAVKVIEQAPQGEIALKKLEAEFSPRDKELVAQQNKIKAIEGELEKNALVMKDAERRAKEREILSLKRDLKRATQEFREDYNQRRNEELASLQKIVYRAIVDIARQEQYDLILHEGTVYASDKVDITDKVLKRLGKQ